MSAPYLGDYAEDATVQFKWNTFDSAGASITRSALGNVYVYKDDAENSEIQTGVGDNTDCDGVTGVHHCSVALAADEFYAVGADYTVVVKATTVDGQTVNAVLAHFSIENRFAEVDVTKTGGSNIQQAGGFFKVKDDEGNTVANEGKQDIIDTLLDQLKQTANIQVCAIGADPAPTTTTVFLDGTVYEDVIDVHDIVHFLPADMTAIADRTTVVVTAVSSGPPVITFAPALSSTPTPGTTVIIQSNKDYLTKHLSAIPASPTADSPNERLKAIDDKLPDGTISDFDEYRGCANVGYDGSTLTVNAWLEHRGEVVTNPSSCIVTIYDDAGTQQFELSDDSADAQGVFKMTRSSPGLAAGKSYYAKVQITASGSTYVTIEGVATL